MAKINPGSTWWKHRKRAYFGHVCTNPPMQMRKIDLRGYWTKVHEIFY